MDCAPVTACRSACSKGVVRCSNVIGTGINSVRSRCQPAVDSCKPDRWKPAVKTVGTKAKYIWTIHFEGQAILASSRRFFP